ncbi:MAG: endonuclease/exonuclease/phosphatase family protein [Bryobacteraceae bacterium]
MLTPRLFCVGVLHGLLWAQAPDLPSIEWRNHVTSVREQSFVRPTALNSIRVVTWNIDHGNNLDPLTAAMAGDSADLCLLQEVDWGTKRTEKADVAGQLAGRLHLNLAYGVEFEELSQEEGGPAFIGQATLTRLPIRRSRVLRFEHQSGFWRPRSWIPSSLEIMQRRVGGRVALVSDLEFGGRLLVVYNAHLESRSYGRIQNEQLDEMLADLSRNYPPDTTVILGGDLNTKYFPSWFLRKLEKAGFRSALGEHVQRTHKIAFTLDWIFVRGPVEVESAAVEKDWKGSDHYALRTELVSNDQMRREARK